MIKSSSNFLYDKETGKSVNADGVELTAANFVSLAEFKDYLLGGIEAIQQIYVAHTKAAIEAK